MKTNERDWQRLNELLDERREPLDDAGLRAWLAEDGEALEQYSRMRGVLHRLEKAPKAPPTWKQWALPIAAGLLGLLGLQHFAATNTSPLEQSRPQPQPTNARTEDTPPGLIILEYSLTIETESADGRTTTAFDGERRTREVERLIPSNAVSGFSLATTITTTSFQ